ncbi:hypothetical protein ACTA71_000132 [Dictyostelium dimigraforme]
MSFKISKISELEELISISRSTQKDLKEIITQLYSFFKHFKENMNTWKLNNIAKYQLLKDRRVKIKEKEEKNIERKVELQKVKDELLEGQNKGISVAGSTSIKDKNFRTNQSQEFNGKNQMDSIESNSQL